MLQENAGQAARISALLKQFYGQRSEKIDPNQLRLFLDALSEDPIAAAVADELPPELTDEPLPRPKAKPAPHGRKPLPADLPRETIDLEPLAQEKHCAACDADKVLIGYETSELLEWIPGHFLVQVLL